MRGHDEALRARGAKLVFVGTGTPAMAADFRAQFELAWPVLSDPTRAAFAAAGMRRGLWSTLHWRTLRNALRAWRAGFRQARVLGDPWQQGGALVFAPDGALRFEGRDGAGGDLLDVPALLAAL